MNNPVTDRILLTFERGDMVMKEWLYSQLNPYLLSETDRKFERNRLIGQIKTELLDVGYALVNRGDNYYILKPNEHDMEGKNILENGVFKAFHRADAVLSATDVSQLSLEESRTLADTKSAFGRFKQMTIRGLKNVRKNTIAQRESGEDCSRSDQETKTIRDDGEEGLQV